MKVEHWDTQVELARTAMENAFQVADDMADRIEELEAQMAKAVEFGMRLERFAKETQDKFLLNKTRAFLKDLQVTHERVG